MNKLIVFICITIYISYVFAAVARIPGKNSKYPNKCYYEGPPEILMEVGTKKRLSGSNCAIYTCTDDFTILLLSCGVVGSHKHCIRVPGNPSSPYPRCCDEYVC